MEVILNKEQQQLLEQAAKQQGISVEQLLEQTVQQFLEQRLGKPANQSAAKAFFIRPKPTCH